MNNTDNFKKELKCLYCHDPVESFSCDVHDYCDICLGIGLTEEEMPDLNEQRQG